MTDLPDHRAFLAAEHVPAMERITLPCGRVAMLAHAVDFVHWLRTAEPGECMVYAIAPYLPLLPTDKQGRPAPKRRGAKPMPLAHLKVREAYELGQVLMVQRRLAPTDSGLSGREYIVQRRRRLMPQTRFIERMPK